MTIFVVDLWQFYEVTVIVSLVVLGGYQLANAIARRWES